MSSAHRLPATLALIAVLSLATTGCGASLRRFPLRDPLWVDADQRPFGPAPPAWYSPYVWDGIDNSSFRLASEAMQLRLEREAINVNALDEVPDSSWFTNRLSRRRLTPGAVARGACRDEDAAIPGVDDEVSPPFTITRGKPDGASAGFFVRDARGRVYLMKPDDLQQPERPSAADTIGAAVFFAAGYFTPCNRTTYVERRDLVLAPDAILRGTSGARRPLTEADVERALGSALTDERGRIRVGLSQFIEGSPIGPWSYQGTWDEDPNDVVPHEHRRDVRGMYVLSAWLSHIDSRQENTLATFMGEDVGHVRHYMIDFSDTLGITYEDELMARRFGHAGYADFQVLAEDLLTLGLLDRPWHHAALGPAGPTLGYFDLERFRPEHWRPGYPNPAYERMTERDAAWMTRILARFGDEHIRALVARARFSRPIVTSELIRILVGRRDRILQRWLTRLSPLTEPEVLRDGRTICLEDRAVSSGFRSASSRRYEASAWALDPVTARELEVAPGPEGLCVAVAPGSPGEARYLVIDVVASSEGHERTLPLRLHLYEIEGHLRIAGLERLEHPAPLTP